jgi:uncharacterized phage-associated protein
MARTTANEVANYILCYVHEFGDLITNLKMQKLVYYAQAWFLAVYDKPLFDDRLEAWIHGPVQPSLYQRFKRYGWEPILEEVVCPTFPGDIEDHLQEIMDVYGDLTAHHLERLVHQEDPWKKARGGLPLDERCSNPISHDDMKTFYKSLLDEKGD